MKQEKLIDIALRYLWGKGGLIFTALLWCAILNFKTDIWLILACFSSVTLAWPWIENKFHADMHWIKLTPFYYTHHRHHKNPVPETGLPDLWVVLLYFIIPSIANEYGMFLLVAFSLPLLFWLNLYEFVHYTCHCNYRPRTRLGWKIRINHLKHHNFDESKNMPLLFPD